MSNVIGPPVPAPNPHIQPAPWVSFIQAAQVMAADLVNLVACVAANGTDDGVTLAQTQTDFQTLVDATPPAPMPVEGGGNPP